jgi:hypothetical protein
MILTSYLYVSADYKKKSNGVSSKLAPVTIVTQWIQVVMTNCFWKQWTIVEHCTPCYTVALGHGVTILTGANSLETPLFFL